MENQTEGCHGHAERESQVDGGCFVEPWGISEEPGGYDAADVNHSQAERDRRRAAVMWLHVVRLPCDEAGSGGINTHDLKKE